jgi:hypothetical protein
MIPRPTFILPAQAVVFERGPAAGLPGAGATISTGWFDAYAVLAGDVVVPQSGAIVSANDETITGAGTVAHVGAYFLDVFVDHTNPAFLSLSLVVEAEIAQLLQSAGHPTFRLADLVVPTQDPATGETRVYTHRVVGYARFLRLTVVYPASVPTRFNMSAVLRAA